MKKHIRLIHDQVKRKEHICSFCGKTFQEKAHMQRHSEVIHEGIKRYKCNLCNNAYGQSHELKKHNLKIHEIS